MGLYDLPIGTFRLCDISENICVRSYIRNRVLGIDCEFSNYEFVITNEKDTEVKGSVSKVVQVIRRITYGFDKNSRSPFFNHSSSAASSS